MGLKGDSILATFLTCRSLTLSVPPLSPPSSHFSPPPSPLPSEIAPSVGELRMTSPAVSQTSRVRSNSSRRMLHPTYSAATGVWKCGICPMYSVTTCTGVEMCGDVVFVGWEGGGSSPIHTYSWLLCSFRRMGEYEAAIKDYTLAMQLSDDKASLYNHRCVHGGRTQ